MQTQAQIHWKDYYQILGFTRENFDSSQVKARYRKVAREKHPDIVGKTPENTRVFQDLNEAYEVLNDEKLRRQYEGLYDQKRGEQREEKRKGEQVKSRPTETGKRTTTTEPKPGSADWGFSSFWEQFVKHDNKFWDEFFRGEGGLVFPEIMRNPGSNMIYDPFKGWIKKSEWEEEQKRLNEQSERIFEERQAKYAQEKAEEKRKGQERRLREEGEKQRKKQEAKDNFLSKELELTETDQYLLSAMTKLLRDKKNGGNLSEIHVFDDMGNIMWEVGIAESLIKENDFLHFAIKRSLTDFLGDGKGAMVYKRRDWNMVEVKEGLTFTMQDMEDAYVRNWGKLPENYRDQFRNLGLLAEVLTNDEGYNNQENLEAVTKINKYAVEEKAILGETKKMKIGEIEIGLREDRFREIPQIHEGMVSRV